MDYPLDSRCDAAFLPLLEQNGLRILEKRLDTAYGVWPDFTLAYVNPAWFKFAAGNGAGSAVSCKWTIGRSTLDAVPEVLKPWYKTLLTSALNTVNPHPVCHEYDCSSGDMLRTYLMTIYPLRNAERSGLLIIHSLSVESPHRASDHEPPQPEAQLYTDSSGFVHQCIHCRRIRTAADPSLWHWVPDWVRNPWPKTSHGLCRICLQHYYRPIRAVRELAG